MDYPPSTEKEKHSKPGWYNRGGKAVHCRRSEHCLVKTTGGKPRTKKAQKANNGKEFSHPSRTQARGHVGFNGPASHCTSEVGGPRRWHRGERGGHRQRLSRPTTRYRRCTNQALAGPVLPCGSLYVAVPPCSLRCRWPLHLSVAAASLVAWYNVGGLVAR